MDLTGARAVFWDSLTLCSSQFFAIPLGILASALTVRLLGAEEYGRLSVLMMVSGLFSLFIANWSSTALLRFGREEYQKTGKINRTVWARYFLFAVSFAIALPVLFLAGEYISSYIGGSCVLWILPIILLTVIVQDANSSFSYMLQALKKMKAYSASLLFIPFFLVLVLGTFFYLFNGRHFSFVTVALITALCGGAAAFFIFLLVPLKSIFPITLNKLQLKEIYIFSYPVIFGNLAFYVVNWVDMVVIKHYFSMKDVGCYQVAYNVYSMVASQMSVINTIMLPLFVSMIALEKGFLIRRYIRSLVPQFFLGGILIVCIGASISPLFFRYAYGRAFEISACYFLVLSLGLAFKVLIYLYSGILIAHKHVKLSMTAGIAGALLNFGGDLLLIPLMGPLGATVATSSSVLLCAVLYHIFIGIKITKGPSSLRLFLLTIPVFISLAITYFVNMFWAPPLVALASLLSVFFLAKALKLFKKEDIELFQGISMPESCRNCVIKIYGFLSA
ncbi:MAG: hypothetical protein A2017_14845 [Lentisphaerae bacterium GWF2_44_16]|nr:MAG: hypothetical protein A2017_14845 [Lentisphaerae bacterium GWF2_44_16]